MSGGKDVIDHAIEHGYHKTNHPAFQGKTWADFERMSAGQTVILFGVGQGAEFYYYKYGERAAVDIIVDSNEKLHGRKVREILWEELDTRHQDITVDGVERIDEFPPDEIVVLIASLRYYHDIATILDKRGVTNYFSVLCMETIYRINHQNSMPDTSKNRFLQRISSLPIDRRKIFLFTEFEGAGHTKELVRNLLKMRNDLSIIWAMPKQKAVPMVPGIEKVSYSDMHTYMRELSASYIWLIDNGLPDVLLKRPGQLCIQLNHWSSVTLKMFGYDLARYRNDEAQIKVLDRMRDTVDYIMVGSKFDEETSRKGFAFSGKVFYAGSPRSDVLFQPESAVRAIYKAYPQFKGFKLLLYAPTFRVRTPNEYQVVADNIDLDFTSARAVMEKCFGGKWLILLRLHPLVATSSKNIPHPGYVIDVSDYYDSEELIAASDAMVTDYSSIMFEPAFVHKPVFLLATDRERYVKEERGFLIDYDTLPFPRASSNEELARNIENFDEEKYVRDVDAFLEKYGVHEDGHAGERAARFILDLIDGKIPKPVSNPIVNS